MSILLESASRKAEQLGAVEVSEKFVKANVRRLRIVLAAPFEPTIQHDTIIYQGKESGKYYKLVRLRK